MPATSPLVLLVDGNNLAHFIHQFSNNNPVSTADIQLLSMQLSMYVRSAGQPVVVELCLDHFHPDHPLPVMGGVKVFVAGLQEEADDLLRQRFRYHFHQNHPCLVVTNDRQVREDVQEEGGASLLVYDFVRRQGKKPVFREPKEFGTLIKRGGDPSLDEPVLHQSVVRPTRRPAPMPQVAQSPEAPLEVVVREAPAEETQVLPPVPQPTYRLTLDTWPLESGVRFLVDSFCPEHGAEYRELYKSLKDYPLVPADLYDLAAALVTSCGTETGFAARGSLIDRVRLALLLSPEEDVPLSRVAELTGMPIRGLHGRIKEKARGWLRVM